MQNCALHDRKLNYTMRHSRKAWHVRKAWQRFEHILSKEKQRQNLRTHISNTLHTIALHDATQQKSMAWHAKKAWLRFGHILSKEKQRQNLRTHISNTLHTIAPFCYLFGLPYDSLQFWLWLTTLLVLPWLLRSRRRCVSIVSTDLGKLLCRGACTSLDCQTCSNHSWQIQ